MRLAFVTLALVALAALAVSATAVDLETEAPVPEGFTLPNIFNSVTDRADGRDQAKVLVNLVAKEPQVAYGVGGPEAAIEDTWNGEVDPESSASVAQKKMLKEVDSLEGLIAQGQKILKVLPRKQARLALLKQKLAVILDAKAKREASEKLDQQQALLDAIKKREGAMSSRLNALKSSQSKLESSVTKLKSVIEGEKPAAAAAAVPQVAATKGAAKKSAAASKGRVVRFADQSLDSDAEADIAAEFASEAEMELDQEVDMEAEMQMANEAEMW